MANHLIACYVSLQSNVSNPANGSEIDYSWKDVTRMDSMGRKSEQEGSITKEERARQEQEIRLVARYCMLDIDCRREQVLRYFGQAFDRADCNETCDNCQSGRVGSPTDMTAEATQLVQLVSQLSGNVTRHQCVAIYRGAKNKELRDRGWDESPLFGEGSHLDQNTVERLVTFMLIDQILAEFAVQNKGGFHTDYLKVCLFLYLVQCTNFGSSEVVHNPY